MASESKISAYANGISKRVFDICVSLPLLILTSPIILVAGLLVMTTSPGPAIFSQTRIGRQRRAFVCHKLRSMAAGTASVPTHEALSASITPVGRFIRATKIDELPQLWNVLQGEMSLVGPRPCLPTQDELVERRSALGVFALRPGITGLAQVNGVDMSEPAKLADLDAVYARRASFGGDIRILIGTVIRRGPIGL